MFRHRRLTARLVGWIYFLSLTGLILFATTADEHWRGPHYTLFIGTLLLSFAVGFLLARFFHHGSLIFELFYRFGNLQTSGGELPDRCLMNCSILSLLGVYFILMAIFGF